MIIAAGALDRRIEIISLAKVRDALGQEEPATETVVATIWAQRLEYRTTDLAQGPGKQAVAIGRYLIRFRPDLTTAHRVRIDGTTYSITGIAEPDSRATQVLTLETL